MENIEHLETDTADLIEALLRERELLPTVKVGDTLYHIRGNEIEEARVGAVNLEYTMDDGTGPANVWWLRGANIGVTTFLTREEAEKALKEVKRN